MRVKAITGFGVTLLFVLAFAIVFYLSFKTVVVSGPSMEETFHSGDRLLASKAYWLVGPIRKKDIVVIKSETEQGYLIKRVAYMPGETVDYVNVPDTWSLANGDYVVPEGKLFVLGDNYAASEDSRKFGPIPAEDVLGKIVRMPDSWGTLLAIVLGAVFVILLLSYGISALLERRRRPTPEAQ